MDSEIGSDAPKWIGCKRSGETSEGEISVLVPTEEFSGPYLAYMTAGLTAVAPRNPPKMRSTWKWKFLSGLYVFSTRPRRFLSFHNPKIMQQNKRQKHEPPRRLLTPAQMKVAAASATAEPASEDDPVICRFTSPPPFDPVTLAQLTPHPLDSALTFEEESHIYTIQYTRDGPFCSDGIVSTSGFVHGFFGHFDPETVLPKMRRGRNFATSIYANMTDCEIKSLWETNGARASARGTLLHFLLECHMNGYDLANSLYAGLEDVQAYFRWRKEYFEPNGLVPFRTELRFSTGPDLRLTGTADLLAIRDDHAPPEDTGGVLSLHLIDWKFSKGVKHENKFGSGSGPCAHLPDCNGSHYSLQQNIYKWFIENYHGEWTWRGHHYTSVKIVQMSLAVFHRNHGASGLMVDITDEGNTIQNMLAVRRKQILCAFPEDTNATYTHLLRPSL